MKLSSIQWLGRTFSAAWLMNAASFAVDSNQKGLSEGPRSRCLRTKQSMHILALTDFSVSTWLGELNSEAVK